MALAEHGCRKLVLRNHLALVAAALGYDSLVEEDLAEDKRVEDFLQALDCREEQQEVKVVLLSEMVGDLAIAVAVVGLGVGRVRLPMRAQIGMYSIPSWYNT
jgi:hypothetical protein